MTHRVRVAILGTVITCSLTALPSSTAAQTTASQPLTTTTAPAAISIGANDVRGIFASVIQDFRRLPSKETLVILSAGGIVAATGHGFDGQVTQALSSSNGMHEFLESGNTLGGARAQMAGALATYAVGRFSRNSKVSAIGADLIRAQIMTQTITAGIKFGFQRTRPNGESGYSFPSGHSSVTFATATVLQRHLGWKAGIPAYGLATYVAASRVQTKWHYLSDVAFGAAIGIAAGRTVTIGHGDAKFAVGPAAAPGGAGINFTWVGK